MCHIKVGQTYFKNTDFIYYAINEGIVTVDNASFYTAHPPKLGEMIVKKEIDVAPIPAIMYAEHSDELLLLPDFSISSNGETKSILLFSDEYLRLEELRGKKIAVPGTSASSVALLRIMLRERGIDSEIIYHEKPDIEDMLKKAEAALLIGDHALVAEEGGRHRILADLGTEWLRLTGRRMIFAVWAVREEFANKCPKAVQNLTEKLRESRRYAYKNIEEVSKELAGKAGISPALMEKHLSLLNYGLDSELVLDLKEFFERARIAGIVNGDIRLRIFGDTHGDYDG